MVLELKQEEMDRLTQLINSPQGNRITQFRRAPQIEEWQLSKAKEMITSGIPPIKIRAECRISIHKFRKVRDGVYDLILSHKSFTGTKAPKTTRCK